MSEGEEEDQLSLLPPPARVRAVARKAKPPREKKPVVPAEVDPVARVLVDVPLAHLDRPFDYAVPESMAEGAEPGTRVYSLVGYAAGPGDPAYEQISRWFSSLLHLSKMVV